MGGGSRQSLDRIHAVSRRFRRIGGPEGGKRLVCLRRPCCGGGQTAAATADPVMTIHNSSQAIRPGTIGSDLFNNRKSAIGKALHLCDERSVYSIMK